MEQLILLIVVAFIAGLLLFWTLVLALYIIFCEYYELKIHYLTPKKSGIVNNSSGLSSATMIASGSNQPTNSGSGRATTSQGTGMGRTGGGGGADSGGAIGLTTGRADIPIATAEGQRGGGGRAVGGIGSSDLKAAGNSSFRGRGSVG